MPKAKDPYLVLGVPRGAGIDEVKRAYRRLVLALHPDRTKECGAVDRLRDVQHAYETLQDPKVRDLSARVQHPTTDDGDSDVPVRGRPTNPIEGEPEPEPLTYSNWRHGVRFRPEPFATREAESLAGRTRRVFTEVDEQLGGIVPEVLPGRPASVSKDLFVEVVLTEHEALLGGTFPLTIPIQKQCRACLGSGLGGLTRHCSYCEGHGYRMKKKELELVIPAGVHNGQQTQMNIASEGKPVVLRVLVRVA